MHSLKVTGLLCRMCCHCVNVEVNVSGQLTEHLCMVNRGIIIPITQYLEETQVNAICHTFLSNTLPIKTEAPKSFCSHVHHSLECTMYNLSTAGTPSQSQSDMITNKSCDNQRNIHYRLPMQLEPVFQTKGTIFSGNQSSYRQKSTPRYMPTIKYACLVMASR
jgi:hypothetical protein